MHLESGLVFDDGLEDALVVERKCRDGNISHTRQSEAIPPINVIAQVGEGESKFEPTVEYSGKTIFKSILVLELNGSPFLSKDRLTRIRNSVYFNNFDDYLNAANSTNTRFLGLGSDCGVFLFKNLI